MIVNGLSAIKETISCICSEIATSFSGSSYWERLSEEHLLHEAAICIFSSQMLFELAVAAADRVQASGILQLENIKKYDRIDYEARIISILTDPINLMAYGVNRSVKMRFRNRLSYLLTATVFSIYGDHMSFQCILKSATSSREAREALISKVVGFGPKQASLFLRRIGYCSELAVLDTHILDYLRMDRGINVKPSMLSKVVSYEKIENEFVTIASEYGFPVGDVDFAMWLTMRVAKGEGII